MSRLHELLARWDEAAITEREMDELARLLESREARAELAAHWSLSQGLREALPLTAPAPAPREASPTSRRGWLVAAGLALLALALGWALWPRPSAQAPIPIGTLLDLGGEVHVIGADGQSAPAEVGQPLYEGQSVETAGDDAFAAIVCPDATRLELHASTRVRLVGGKVHFESGTMRAAVAPRREGEPLVLATPRGDLRASESSFLISSPDPESVRVDMEEGSAEMVSGDGLVTHMGGGSSADAGPAGSVVRPTPAALVQPARSFDLRQGRALRYLPDGGLQAASFRELRTLREGAVTSRALPGKKGEGRILLGGGRLILAAPAQASVYDLGTLAHVATLPVRPGPLALSPDGSTLAWVSQKPKLVHLAGTSGEPARTLPLAGPAPVALALGEGVLAVASSPKSGPDLRLIPLDGGAPRVLRGAGATPRHIALAPGLTAASSGDGAIRLWRDADTPAATLRQHGRAVTALAVSADGQLMAAGTPDGQAWLYDASTAELACVIQAGPRAVWGLAFSPDGKRLAAGTQNGPLSVWILPAR